MNQQVTIRHVRGARLTTTEEQEQVLLPVVSRDPFPLHGRITQLLESGELEASVGREAIDPASDRIMICGGMAMLGDLSKLLDTRGFAVSPSIGDPGDYVFERAFVSR